MKTIARGTLFLLLCTPFLGTGCGSHRDGSAQQQDNFSAGANFRERWWNYFERAVEHADEQAYPMAVADLTAAIAQRKEDQRMARTYGMHFIDYFPHRELGIVYYHQGKLPEAEKELEISIGHYPSAKAYYYRDLVRKATIELSAARPDPPIIELDIEEDEHWTRDDPVVLSGAARDTAYVSRLTIQGEAIYQDSAQKRLDFHKRLPLSAGKHPIEIIATSLAGKKTRRTIIFNIDRQGPTISVDSARLDNKSLVLTGFVHDPAGIDSMFANGDEVDIDEENGNQFAIAVDPDLRELRIEVSDRLGSRTSARISVPNLIAQADSPVLLAANEINPFKELLKTFSMPVDKNPPDIRLRDWEKHQTIFLEKIYLDGMVQDRDKIITFQINGKPISQKPGKLIIFNHLIELTEGKNTILLEAEDVFGNRTVKKLAIERRIPSALQLKERLRLGVFPFEHKGVVSSPAAALQDNLINALLRRNRFRVVDRSMLDIILNEQKISQTRLIDPATRLVVGKLAAAQSIVGGSIVENKTGIEIICRVVDAETTDVLASVDAYSEQKEMAAYRNLAQRLAIKIHREFPLVEGSILKKDGRTIITDLGNSEIKIQRRILVYKETPILQPQGGTPLGTDHQVVGRARIVQVDKEISKAELSYDSSSRIDITHKVISE